MTDKELDELEARLRERKRSYEDIGAPSDQLCTLLDTAADAIAELREKNAGLVGRIERLKAIARPLADEDWNPDEYPCDAPATCLDLLRHQARHVLKDKENTQ